MIYEIRTYSLTVGSVAEFEKRFAEAYEYRKKYSELVGFWHTEIGPLNEVVHVWPYQDLADRARVRAELTKEPNWPPKTGEFIRSQHSDVLIPFPFSPLPKPGKVGPIYEMRIYAYKPGTLPDTIKSWESKISERMKLSPLVIVGGVDLGEVNRFIHIWAYSSLEQRAAVRTKARELGLWPPPGGPARVLTQANKIMMPSAFSPMQ